MPDATADGEPRAVRISAAEQALSACSGAVLTSLFVTPLDVIKVKMQHNSSITQLQCEHAACAGTSSTSMLMRVARHEVRHSRHPGASAQHPP